MACHLHLIFTNNLPLFWGSALVGNGFDEGKQETEGTESVRQKEGGKEGGWRGRIRESEKNELNK